MRSANCRGSEVSICASYVGSPRFEYLALRPNLLSVCFHLLRKMMEYHLKLGND
jgi:hypothetical protein